MQRENDYVGFPPLREPSAIMRALLSDPPEIRWRVVRDLFQIKDSKDREVLIEMLQPRLEQIADARVKSRVILALQALHRPPMTKKGYFLVRHKGVYTESALEQLETPDQQRSMPPFLPVVDFHMHPKTPDLKLLSDLREAGVTHGVILATDTDPADVDRPEVRHQLKEAFCKTSISHHTSFDSLLRHIKAGLLSPTLVTNQDVADWVKDYPDLLTGFGSINLSKDKSYVDQKLAELKRLKLRGIKFLPHAQFFNPADNEHMDRVFDFCRQTGLIILTHTGCGPGPFEILELSQNSNPVLWEPWLKKYADVPVVFAHFGARSTVVPGIWLFETLQLGKKYPNVYADLSEVDWLMDREMVVQEIRKTIGFNRVLFASNYPLPLSTGGNLANIVKGIRANSNLTPKEKNKVLGQNAAHLLGLS
jgi:predicted TIM-barrel fold metal-dependent hydrolase